MCVYGNLVYFTSVYPTGNEVSVTVMFHVGTFLSDLVRYFDLVTGQTFSADGLLQFSNFIS